MHNLLTGETITLRSSAEGELAFDLELRPLAVAGGMAHRHRPAEHFEIRSGELLAFVAGRAPQRVAAGGEVDVPGGTWHMLLALTRAQAHVTVAPAMRFADLLTCAAAVGSGDVRPATLRRLNALLREHECAPRLPL